MTIRNSFRRNFCVPLFAVATLLVAQMIPAYAGNDNPGVLPPNSHSNGATYAEWSARWWIWVLQQPVPTSPLLDTTGANCAAGQSGQVWYLAGTFGPGTATRSCTIPTGKALFFPVGNFFCAKSVLPGDAGLTYDICKQMATQGMNTLTNLRADIDGVPVSNLQQYRVVSPEWSVVLPQNNLFNAFGVPGLDGTELTEGASDGVYLMLAPLSAGHHVIHSHVDFPDGPIDVTYNLTVGH